MAVALGAFALLPGLAVGSFLNVVAARLPERRSLLHPRSACGSCAAPIAWYDNVPLLSYTLLRGRCRSCGTRISPLYPAVELATAALLVACLVSFRPPLPFSARRWS
jgi:leader peptidase (prepilin peptidase)/N-methyltransferase